MSYGGTGDAFESWWLVACKRRRETGSRLDRARLRVYNKRHSEPPATRCRLAGGSAPLGSFSPRVSPTSLSAPAVLAGTEAASLLLASSTVAVTAGAVVLAALSTSALLSIADGETTVGVTAAVPMLASPAPAPFVAPASTAPGAPLSTVPSYSWGVWLKSTSCRLCSQPQIT